MALGHFCRRLLLLLAFSLPLATKQKMPKTKEKVPPPSILFSLKECQKVTLFKYSALSSSAKSANSLPRALLLPWAILLPWTFKKSFRSSLLPFSSSVQLPLVLSLLCPNPPHSVVREDFRNGASCSVSICQFPPNFRLPLPSLFFPFPPAAELIASSLASHQRQTSKFTHPPPFHWLFAGRRR
jgi:hypothetical protein